MKQSSIRVKLLWYFLAVVTLPLIGLGFLGPIITARSIEKETADHTLQLMQQLTWNLELGVREMENLAYYLSREPGTQELLDGAVRDPDRRAGLRAQILGRIAVYEQAHPEIAGMMLLGADDHDVSPDLVRINRDPLVKESWYRLAVEEPDRIHLLPRPIGRNIRNLKGESADRIVSVIKAVRLPDDRSPVAGVILIDLKLSIFEELFGRASFGRSGFLFLTDSNGAHVFAPVNDIVYRIHPAWLQGPDQGTVRRIRGSEYRIVYLNSPYTRWQVAGVFSLAEMQKEVNLFRTTALIIAGVTMALALALALWFSGSIARPVVALRSIMKKAEDGDLAVRYQEGSADEIGQLGRSFNQMIAEIQKLVQLVYHEQQSKREAEIRILHEQIKPHFLYNTLDTIQWMAVEQGAGNVVEMVGALTRLFRIGLSRGKEMITVAEELEHVSSYLIIQKARYGSKFNYEIACGEDLEKLQFLKLTLQPLVENAIYHGVKERRGTGTIKIRAWRQEGPAACLMVTVGDDGAGMDGERLDQVRAMLGGEAPGPGTSGYALFNVHSRLHLSFGPGYGLQIDSQPGIGTTVTVRHPILA